MTSERYAWWRPSVVFLILIFGFSSLICFGNPLASLGTLANDPTDANITRVTSALLEHSQYLHRQLTKELAGKFVERYLDALDPGHQLFLQSDEREFAAFRENLPEMTRWTGDVSPARIIFQRYLVRLGERNAWRENLWRVETFDFTGDDTVSLDNNQAPRPLDLHAAQALWRTDLRAEYLQEKLADKSPKEIMFSLNMVYHSLLMSMRRCTAEDVLDIYLNALAHAYDPHSDFFGPEQMEDFSTSMKLSLVGIGVTLSGDQTICQISDLVPGGPAARSGLLKPGDRIVAVGEGEQKSVNIQSLPLSDAVKLMRGPIGSVIRLTVISVPKSIAPKVVTLVRDEVKLEGQEAKASVVEWPQAKGVDLRLGVINLPSFYGSQDEKTGAITSSATADVAILIRKLQALRIQGLVLDLRQNGGGSLKEAISISGLFLRAGPIVQTRDLDGHKEIATKTSSAMLYSGPLIVLTSRFTASASEILAGALQDYGRALIVGDPSTFGKGTVQTVIPMAMYMDEYQFSHSFDPGALKLTIEKFYLPSGASTQLRGVSADISLPSLSGASELGEAGLRDPLSWDRIPSAVFVRDDQVSTYLKELRSLSKTRVDNDQDFVSLREDIAQFQIKMTRRVMTLNEATRRQEMAADKMREDSDLLARAELKGFSPKTYALCVEGAVSTDLPSRLPVVLHEEIQPEIGNSSSNDTILLEAEHIMVDYVALRKRDGNKGGWGDPLIGAGPIRFRLLTCK